MWHLENPDEPGIRIGGYFFTKEIALARAASIQRGVARQPEGRLKNFKLKDLIAVDHNGNRSD